MDRRKPLNREIIRSNIAEAIEELQRLESKLAEGTLAEGHLQVGLLHAYHHLNFAWNVRRISTSAYAHLTQEQFQQWGTYPRDIEEL